MGSMRASKRGVRKARLVDFRIELSPRIILQLVARAREASPI